MPPSRNGDEGRGCRPAGFGRDEYSMKEKRSHKMTGRIAVMFFILLFVGQHSVICWSASSSQSLGEESNSASRHMGKSDSHPASSSMETDCSQPCHFSPMKMPTLVLKKSYDPEINKALQEAFPPEGVRSSVFHPPRLASFPSHFA